MTRLAELVQVLARPAAFPYAVEAVEVRQTHISVVFLAGPFAYKIKKPVQLGFLDFSTLERRRFFCEEELRLNRRLAPKVYLGVVPVAAGPQGLAFEAPGPAIEWAVKMHRLPDEATLEQRVESDLVTDNGIALVAERLAAFHSGAQRSPRIAEFGRFEAVSKNLLENLQRAQVSARALAVGGLWHRTHQATRAALERLRPLIEQRAARQIPCDTHGDLHLDHVYLFPEQPAPDDLVIVDCIEFNERFRYTDPAADAAFLAMDLKFHGRHDLAHVFLARWITATQDEEARPLLPLYTSYRAAVRAKVEGILCEEREVPQVERDRAALRAKAHWLLAMAELVEPHERPCLLAVAGLPGTGKSTLAAALAAAANCRVFRTDVVRKELAGIPATQSGRQAYGAGMYEPRAIDQAYAECLRRAAVLVAAGGRVIIDATFAADRHRLMLMQVARACGAQPLFLVCEVAPHVAKARIENRRGDASDADWHIHQQAAALWQVPSAQVARAWHAVSMEGTTAAAVEQAISILRDAGLA